MQLSNFFFEVTILALFYFDDINTLHKVVAKKKCKTNVRQYSLVTLSNTWQFAVPLAAFNYWFTFHHFILRPWTERKQKFPSTISATFNKTLSYEYFVVSKISHMH